MNKNLTFRNEREREELHDVRQIPPDQVCLSRGELTKMLLEPSDVCLGRPHQKRRNRSCRIDGDSGSNIELMEKLITSHSSFDFK